MAFKLPSLNVDTTVYSYTLTSVSITISEDGHLVIETYVEFLIQWFGVCE